VTQLHCNTPYYS